MHMHCFIFPFSLKYNQNLEGNFTMRILICDDDDLIAEQLKKYLCEYFSKNGLICPEIAAFDSGEALLADSGDKDIVFLDVEMPGVSGIHTGKELKKVNPDTIIFIVTSFMEYLDEAMRFHVFRYLSKPLDKQRLFRNLKDALELYNTTNVRLAVETKQGVHSVSAADIVCVEAQSRKVIIHTTFEDYESIHTMQYWTDALSMPCFFQSHRSFIVNLAYVEDFDHTLIFLYHHHFEAYLTRRKYSQFKAAYLMYLEGVK